MFAYPVLEIFVMGLCQFSILTIVCYVVNKPDRGIAE